MDLDHFKGAFDWVEANSSSRIILHDGVSCTGEGEAIIQSTLAREVAAVMGYKGYRLQEAVDYVIKHRLDEGFAELGGMTDFKKKVRSMLTAFLAYEGK